MTETLRTAAKACAAFSIVIVAACAGATSTPSTSLPDAASSMLSNPLLLRIPGGRAIAAAPPMQRTRFGSWASRDAGHRQALYVADPSLDGYYGAICYYAASGGTQLGCLAGGPSSISGIDFPQGTWIDAHKNLFVANGGSSSGYSGQVTQYKLPLEASSKPINTLYSNVTNPSQGAMLAYVCGDKKGNVYGTTLYSTTTAVWKAGTTNSTPTATLVDSNLANVGSPSLADGPVACATDAAGNLFISGQFAIGYPGNWQYYAELDEFVGGMNGSGSPTLLQRETSDLYFPAGVAIDKHGNLAWALFDLSDSGSSVCQYAKPYTANPISCTSGFATGFHFTKKGKDLWGGDTTVYPWYAQPGSQRVANEIVYPGGGLLRSTSGSGLLTPVDASIDPPLVP